MAREKGIPPQRYFIPRPNIRFRNWKTGEIGVTGKLLPPRKKGNRQIGIARMWVLYLEPIVYRMIVSQEYAHTTYEEIPV